MEFNLYVEQGPYTGREYKFSGDEAANRLVGRYDQNWEGWKHVHPQEYWGIADNSDDFVSRPHFTLEFRPPNCLLRDPNSVNGTRLRHKDQTEWVRVEEALLEDGDEIKVSEKTCLRIAQSVGGGLSEQPAAESGFPVTPTRRAEEGDRPAGRAESADGSGLTPPGFTDNEMFCIRCGTEMTPLALEASGDIQSTVFMCPKCRKAVEAERKKAAAKKAEVHFSCGQCGRDLTGMADQDGKAHELAEVADYLCKACAEKAVRGKKQRLAEYLILGELGRGGMGIVYRVWHEKTGRVAALKQMLPMMRVQETAYRRFLRETSIMQDLCHPNLVRMFAVGQVDQAPYFVSELVPDGNLDQFVSDDGTLSLDPPGAAQIIADALVGLHYLHGKGYVHRDLKPENILVRRKGGSLIPKLVDFGLARSFEKHGGTVSRSGEAAGTILYMPPEQLIAFKESRPPVDTYAMGVILYYLLTGAFPLNFPSKADMRAGRGRVARDPVRMILRDNPTPVGSRRSDIPADLCRVVDKAVEKDARGRYQSAEEFRRALLDLQA